MCSYCRCSFSLTPRRCFSSGILNPLQVSGSAALADRLDQIPLAHLRTAGDVLVLGDLVQLLAIAILERAAGLAAALTASGRLLAELAARALRKPRDRALPPRRLLCLLHVLLRGPYLARRSHPAHLHPVRSSGSVPRADGCYSLASARTCRRARRSLARAPRSPARARPSPRRRQARAPYQGRTGGRRSGGARGPEAGRDRGSRYCRNRSAPRSAPARPRPARPLPDRAPRRSSA